ncbi:MAG TPA: PKD domain-containing protein [Chitinophagales bacterium]|nr:PKD domain-containing protein [Chitinophagales bacterium]HNF67807.1 PKD domain-containing protein [Chitinophagales bacterium]
MKRTRLLLLSLMTIIGLKAHASHIIGGEISYTCIGTNQYQVVLILYRDCTSFTPFDNPAYMTIYTQDGDYVNNFPLYSPFITGIPAESDNPCLDAPDDVCVEQAIYTAIITVPDGDQGYLLVFQRCCRNAGIVNIETPDDIGATYTQEIPPQTDATCNTSPVFNAFPPTVICIDDPIVFDHSATDIDGDSLAYDFYWPLQGASSFDPAPVIAAPPPYDGVVWVTGYDELYPLDAVPAFAIDPVTGILTGTATAEGRYVVGVRCKEYRDGVWLGDHIRDFQFNVVTCTPTVVAQMDVGDATFDDTTPDDEYLNCSDFTVIFDNYSIGGTEFFWDFGDGSTSTLEDPTHVYADTGTYTVMLIVNPGFVCADTAIGIIKLYNTLTAAYDYSAGCSGTPVTFEDNSNSTEAGDIITWDWNFGDGATSTTANPEHEYADGGTYTVVLTVTTDVGCQSSVSVDILVEPGPDVDFLAPDVCQDEEAEFTNLTTITTGSISSYSWDFGDGATSTEDEPSHQYDAPGTYTVTLIAYSANGCSDTLEQDIYIGMLPDAYAGVDDTIMYLETYTLNGTGTGDFVWDPQNPIVPPASISSLLVANPTIELAETTTFVLTVTSPDGCSQTDEVTIYVEDYPIVEVPNAFSPNGDGTNDVISAFLHDISELEQFTIFNRWGQVVYTSDIINDAWDGMIDGKEAEMGTYVYLVVAKDTNGDMITRQGNITLVR